MRYICRGKLEPIPELYKEFNKETKDGRNMTEISNLLGQAINSIINVKEESDIDSFLGGSQVSFTKTEIKGLNDFELICFLVVKDSEELKRIEQEMQQQYDMDNIFKKKKIINII